jgi:hypothetical protein
MQRVGAVAAVLLATLSAACRTSSIERHSKLVKRSWYLKGVSADGRTLILEYGNGGCLATDGRVRVQETKSSVAIDVLSSPAVEGFCAMQSYSLPLRARLASPIAGRKIVGGPNRGHWTFLSRTMPRVIGLQLSDAASVFRPHVHGFHIATEGAPDGPVTKQRPSPGAELLPPGSTRPKPILLTSATR